MLFTSPLVSRLRDGAYREVRSGGSRPLGALMPFWYIGTLVALIAAAVALMGAALLLTVTFPASVRELRDFTGVSAADTHASEKGGTGVLADRRAARYS